MRLQRMRLSLLNLRLFGNQSITIKPSLKRISVSLGPRQHLSIYQCPGKEILGTVP